MKTFISFLFLLCTLISLGQNQALSTGAFFEGEPFLAIHPEHPNQLIVAWMGFGGPSQRIKIKTRTSFDSGATWQPIVEIDHAQSGFTSADPSIAFDVDGNIVVSFIDWTGYEVAVIEGGLYIATSFDDGASFGTPQEVLNVNVALEQKIIDRPWLEIDRTTSSNSSTYYVTSMNGKDALPPFRPLVSIKQPEAATFTLQPVDDEGWLSGAFISQPMPTPAIATNGTFYAVYPSFVPSQNILPQFVIAKSTDSGATFTYNTVFASAQTANQDGDTLPKRAYLLIANPANENHLAFFFLSGIHDDLDIFITETLDQGNSWTSPSRVNDDTIGNGRMQEMVWADFSTTGDLVVSWRDRRNAPDEGFETASEIWGAYRTNGQNNFAPNFQITSETVPYNDILAGAGNDFLGVQIENNTIHTTWGDPRNGTLTIWYQRLDTEGNILSITNIAEEVLPPLQVFPNPTTDKLQVIYTNWKSITVMETNGKKVMTFYNTKHKPSQEIDLTSLSLGTYVLKIETENETLSHKIIKK